MYVIVKQLWCHYIPHGNGVLFYYLRAGNLKFSKNMHTFCQDANPSGRIWDLDDTLTAGAGIIIHNAFETLVNYWSFGRNAHLPLYCRAGFLPSCQMSLQ